MGKRGVFPPPSTVYWLRDYMIERGEANPYGFFKYCKEQSEAHRRAAELIPDPFLAKEEMVLSKRWGAVSYNSTRKLFYLLHRIGLIELVRTEPPNRGGRDKRFYRIAPSKERLFQGGLQRVLWPNSYWGGRRYKKKKGEVPPEKVLS